MNARLQILLETLRKLLRRNALRRAERDGAAVRCALIGSGQHANLAKHLVEEHDASGRGGLDVELFVRAWLAEARRYSCRTWRKLGLLRPGLRRTRLQHGLYSNQWPLA